LVCCEILVVHCGLLGLLWLFFSLFFDAVLDVIVSLAVARWSQRIWMWFRWAPVSVSCPFRKSPNPCCWLQSKADHKGATGWSWHQ
jgi:hypothetical protein